MNDGLHLANVMQAPSEPARVSEEHAVREEDLLPPQTVQGVELGETCGRTERMDRIGE